MAIVKAISEAWHRAALTVGTGIILASTVLLIGPILFETGLFINEKLIPAVSDFKIEHTTRTQTVMTGYDSAGNPHQIPVGSLLVQGKFYKRQCEFVGIVWLTRGTYGWRIGNFQRFGLWPGAIQNRPRGWQEFAWFVVPSPEPGELSQIVAKHNCGNQVRTTVLYEGRIEEGE